MQNNSYLLRRDLPEPAGDDGRSRRSYVRRASVAIERAVRRHRVITRGRFDLCHVHTINQFTDVVALDLVRRRVPSLVLSVHNVLPHNPRLPVAGDRKSLTLVYEKAARLIVAHETLRDQLECDFGIDAERIAVLPFPVQPVENLVHAEVDTPVILFFGTFRESKGVSVLLASIRKLAHERDVRFHFAGRGEAQIESAIRHAARKDHRVIAEIGYIEPDRKDALFREATLAVMPYVSFLAQSGVLQDAYAYQVPVLVSDVGALGLSVSAEGSGWVVPPGDPSILAEAIRTALHDAPARAVARTRIKEVARDRPPDIIGSRLRSLYDEIK